MTGDVAAVAASIAAASAVLGPPVTWWLARRNHAATAELTEVQAEEMRAQIWTRLQTSLTDEIERLQRQLAATDARLSAVEASLREKTDQLRAAEAERDRLRQERAALIAERDTLRAQLAACRACKNPTVPGGTPR